MNRLRTREGTRQLLTEDRRDGQYQEDTADREKRAVDAGVSQSLCKPSN